MERPERVVLVILGALFDRMAPLSWIIAVLGNLTVACRMVFTYQRVKLLEEAHLRAPVARATERGR
jgi:CDP-diacylglycerol---glycerol-3-phosphate 3-phosphatidyltransferase